MAAVSEQEVRTFLKSWVDAYENGDKSFFDSFAADASVFTISAPTRIDGLDEFRRGFEENFEGGKRRSQILSPEIRSVGDAALVSYHNRVSVGSQTSNMRSTVVIVRQDGNLKIAHLHNSPLQAGGVLPTAKRPEDITLLEERVATAAAAVGTPK